MTCASCAARVEREIKKLRGALHSSVNLASEAATVHSEPGTISLERTSIPVAAGALYSLFHVLLNTMPAAAIMSLSSVFVLTDSP
jgi:cation transport ATPase